MKLYVDSIRGVLVTKDGNEISFGESHKLDTEYCFTAVKLDRRKLGITIWQGSRPVQTEAVHLLSDRIGLAVNGSIDRGHGVSTTWVQKPYSLELAPGHKIFPLGPLVEMLLRAGISHSQISIMPAHDLVDYFPLGLYCQMHSDGEICKETDGNELPSRTYVVVTNAHYAIRTKQNQVDHIYLWPGDRDCSCEILDTVSRLREGTK